MRALLLILDSVGVGYAPDAVQYGDDGANTLGHILAEFPTLRIPTLRGLGVEALCQDSSAPHAGGAALLGRMRERSKGKDTVTGHWEIAGVVLENPFAVFETFPRAVVEVIEQEAGCHFLGNRAASGTVILEELGEEHLRTGNPILYTSADSVLQIAAHEEVVPVDRLMQICRIARQICDPLRIGRVIARPFEGVPGDFRRTARRHDFAMQPPRTILNALQEAGQRTIGVGKIADIFNGSGISESHPTASNREGMEQTARLWEGLENGLLLVNLVDFDMLFGHRRDVAGYARALEEFDQWFAEFLARIGPDDLLILTADHGNDPTWPGTDHTREQVLLVAMVRGRKGDLGVRDSFTDVAATLAEFFQLPPWPVGKSFLES